MTFSIGDRIGQFRVVREIGHGGMGCVYEVVADGDATHLALKAFTLDHGNREFLKKRFLAEAKILSRLNHPRLVHVRELGVDEPSGVPYYVMDLVRSAAGESGTLEDVRKAGKVAEAQALQWFADIREGLEYIHAQGVVHRDVKLENVLIDGGVFRQEGIEAGVCEHRMVWSRCRRDAGTCRNEAVL